MKFEPAFFKGIVNAPSTDAKDAISMHTENNEDRTRFLKLMQEGNLPRELKEDIARAFAAAILAREDSRHGEVGQLISVEGCNHVVGDAKITGAKMMESIWKNVVPAEVMQALPAPILEEISDCTIVEVRAILAHAKPGDSVQGVTHGYHRRRTQDMLKSEAATTGVIINPVLTPEQIAKRLDPRDPTDRFMADVIHSATPTLAVLDKENRNEAMIYAPLRLVSIATEILTGGKVSVERFLAKLLRK